MKIAISGKGGVGKTLLAASLSKAFAESGYSVIAIDADPDANLASTLGYPHPDEISPISEMADLVEERTGMRPGQSGTFFKLNPKVDDLPEKYSVNLNGIKLMAMGRIKRGGTGCYCPEGSLLQALLAHLLILRDEVIILDMEAGIEHLARGTSKSVDKLIVVVEPGRRSIETAQTIKKLAKDIGLPSLAIVGNKIRSDSDQDFIKSSLPGFEFLGFIPYDQALVEADLAGRPIIGASHKVAHEIKTIFQKLLSATRKQSVKS
ncbi:AAA family ATPase [Chloroflexota bacterium]